MASPFAVTTVRTSHVDIIESLPLAAGHAIRTGRSLFDELDGTLRFPARYKFVQTKEEFLSAIDDIAPYIQERGWSPILHIAAHGSEDGLALGSGEILSWHELKEHLVQVNEASRVNLIVFMASCNGAQLVQILQPHDRAPFRLMVGPKRDISFQEIFVGSRAFYKALGRRRGADEAFAALNGAIDIGDNPFDVYIAEQVFLSVMRNYFTEHSKPGVIAEQRRRLMRRWLEHHPHSTLEESAARRGKIDSELNDHLSQYRKIRDTFFFGDKLPTFVQELEGVSFEDCIA